MNNKYKNFTYALRNNELIYIEDVESGLSCNCVCPACNGKLIAKKGEKMLIILHIIPPVYIETDSYGMNIKLFPEMKVTHKVDDAKLEKIRNTGISAIEIDLSKYDRIISKSELKDILVNSSKNKSWLYNNRKEKYYNALCDFSEKIPIISNINYYTTSCSIHRRTYVHYTDECLFCKYLIKINYNEFKNPKSIICSGKNRISTKEDLIKNIKKYL